MNFKKALIFFGFATPVCALLNCLVMFFTIENQSGFFKTGYGSLATLMLAIIIALIVLSCTAFFKLKRPAAPDFWNLVQSACGFLLGICLIVEAFKFTPLIGTGEFLATMIRLFGILSGVTFLIYTIENLLNITVLKIIYVVPVVYYILRIVSAFVYYAAVATMAETALELFAICAMLIFTMNFAKAQNKIKNKKGTVLSLPVSTACAMLIIVQIAPSIANVFFKEEILLHAHSLFVPSSIALFLFIIASSLFAIKSDGFEE